MGKWAKFGFLQIPFCFLIMCLAWLYRITKPAAMPSSFEPEERISWRVQPIWYKYLREHL